MEEQKGYSGVVCAYHVDYVIHRFGEFIIMLMTGEGILSLVIGKLSVSSCSSLGLFIFFVSVS